MITNKLCRSRISSYKNIKHNFQFWRKVMDWFLRRIFYFFQTQTTTFSWRTHFLKVKKASFFNLIIDSDVHVHHRAFDEEKSIRGGQQRKKLVLLSEITQNLRLWFSINIKQNKIEIEKCWFLRLICLLETLAHPGLISLCLRTALYRIAIVTPFASAWAQPPTIFERTKVIVP